MQKCALSNLETASLEETEQYLDVYPKATVHSKLFACLYCTMESLIANHNSENSLENLVSPVSSTTIT